VEITDIDIIDIMRGDSLKNKLFAASYMKDVKLVKGMKFRKLTHGDANTRWTLYVHELSKAELLVIKVYTWSYDSMAKRFTRTYEINNLFDIAKVPVSCIEGPNNHFARWAFTSKTTAEWHGRVYCRKLLNPRLAVDLNTVHQYFEMIKSQGRGAGRT
jgi:hypothetical protein